MRAYVHKYHAFFPLNIYVGIIKRKWKNIKDLLHFWSFVLGIDALMKAVDEEIKKDSID